MAPKVKNSSAPIRGRTLSPCRNTLISRNFTARTVKTRIPNSEWRATRVGESGPAGPTMQVRATSTPRVRASRPLVRWTRTAVPPLTPAKRGRPQNWAAIATCSPARANTMLVRITFQSSRCPPVTSFRKLIMGGSLFVALAGQHDFGVHAGMDGAAVLEGLLDDEAERLAGRHRPGRDRGVVGRDVVGGD